MPSLNCKTYKLAASFVVPPLGGRTPKDRLKLGTTNKERTPSLKSFSRSRPTSRDGFTLIEVVVGLALMASVLVGSMLAFSAHRHQLLAADKKVAAVSVADDVLSRLINSRDGIPLKATGEIPSHPTWYWETIPVGTATPAGVALDVVRFQIIEITPAREHKVHATVNVVKRPPLVGGPR